MMDKTRQSNIHEANTYLTRALETLQKHFNYYMDCQFDSNLGLKNEERYVNRETLHAMCYDDSVRILSFFTVFFRDFREYGSFCYP